MSDDERTREVRLQIRINASPETVFGLLTDPAHMKTWFAELVEADARPGGLFRISGPDGVSIEGTYLEVIPIRKVVFTWGGVEGLKPGQSTVEFLLEPDGQGTLVYLRHYGLPPPTVEAHRRGWVYSGLAKLKDAAEGRRPTRLCLSDLAERRGAE
ncbi:MAG: SRPBCC domain-containing protein [Alphaproteobacteria bacterium]|nr:SRPBCC domain-containing protein [Alphaproteobacteria bacterium]